jgi:chromosomal replication initiation ATPase DnaA
MDDIMKELFPAEMEELSKSQTELKIGHGTEMPKLLLQIICEELNVDREDVLSKSRTNILVFARMIFGWGMRHTSGLSLQRIGKYLSVDHATVLHYIRRIESMIEADQINRDHIGGVVMLMHRHGYGQMMEEYRKILSAYKKPEKFL